MKTAGLKSREHGRWEFKRLAGPSHTYVHLHILNHFDSALKRKTFELRLNETCWSWCATHIDTLNDTSKTLHAVLKTNCKTSRCSLKRFELVFYNLIIKHKEPFILRIHETVMFLWIRNTVVTTKSIHTMKSVNTRWYRLHYVNHYFWTKSHTWRIISHHF